MPKSRGLLNPKRLRKGWKRSPRSSSKRARWFTQRRRLAAGQSLQNRALKKVVIHTDGACQGNPGPGGWAAILECEGEKHEVSGGVPVTTNNRMELQAVIEALSALKEPCEIDFYTDSVY